MEKQILHPKGSPEEAIEGPRTPKASSGLPHGSGKTKSLEEGFVLPQEVGRLPVHSSPLEDA